MCIYDEVWFYAGRQLSPKAPAILNQIQWLANDNWEDVTWIC